ncbi:hypothetical protein EV363DRAFT_247457 [Boletus edulis]|nr:hypothetical protein EV363DRAFT_247457 [Boletus edulis]
MTVMVTENLSMGNKIVNGTEGTLTDVLYQSVSDGREACAYVKVSSSQISIDDSVPTSIVPVFPTTVQFSYRVNRSKYLKVSRTQLPLVPAWAFTDYTKGPR